MKRFVLLFCLFIVGCSVKLDGALLLDHTWEQVELPSDEELLREEVAALSLDEKIGQLLIAGIPNTTVTEDVQRLIEEVQIGGFILFANNLQSAKQSVSLMNDLKSLNEHGSYPLLLSVDQEGGRVTRLPELDSLPTNWEIGQAGNLAGEYGTLIGKQVAAFGFNMDFAPVLDVNNEPNNPVIGDRSFGDHVDIVIDNGLAMLEAMQQTNVIPVVKHFPGHGDVTVDSHDDIPVVDKSLAELRELELTPFRKAIDWGADVVMVGHILLPQLDNTLPASMSEAVVTDLLREELGFNGVVITDDMTMGAITNTYAIADIAPQVIQSGVDVLLIADRVEVIEEVAATIKTSVETGELSEEQLDESVMRIVQLKQTYGLTDDPIAPVDVEQLNDEITQFKNKLQNRNDD